MTKPELINLIHANLRKDKFFSIKARTAKHPEGRVFVTRRMPIESRGVRNWKAEERGLITIYDFVAGGVRSFNVNNIVSVKIKGKTYESDR